MIVVQSRNCTCDVDLAVWGSEGQAGRRKDFAGREGIMKLQEGPHKRHEGVLNVYKGTEAVRWLMFGLEAHGSDILSPVFLRAHVVVPSWHHSIA